MAGFELQNPYSPREWQKIHTAFSVSGGHTHDGTTAGDGPAISQFASVTAGVVTASKAVIVDANKDIGDFRNLDVTNLDAGASGTAGTVDVFPSTASKGKMTLSCADQTGDTTFTFEPAAHGQATKLVVPDSGLATAYAVQSTAAITATEADVLDGAVAANSVASKVALLDASKQLQTNANVGTPGTNVTAVEYGDGYNHVTVLTLTGAALTPTIPADAEGAGAVIYTFPAGVYVGNAAHMDITAGTMDSATNAADLGLGSLIASGDIATLTTAAMEDWVTGQTVADVSSIATEKSTIMTGGAPLLFEAGDSHTLNINIAGTWNATVATADLTGTVTIWWTYLGA